MKFSDVVSGCCMTPPSAPEMIREHIATLNEETEEKLKSGILRHMLIPGWQVKGGWKTWLENIVVAVCKRIAGFFGFNGPEIEPSFEERLRVYFKEQGYDDL